MKCWDELEKTRMHGGSHKFDVMHCVWFMFSWIAILRAVTLIRQQSTKILVIIILIVKDCLF